MKRIISIMITVIISLSLFPFAFAVEKDDETIEIEIGEAIKTQTAKVNLYDINITVGPHEVSYFSINGKRAKFWQPNSGETILSFALTYQNLTKQNIKSLSQKNGIKVELDYNDGFITEVEHVTFKLDKGNFTTIGSGEIPPLSIGEIYYELQLNDTIAEDSESPLILRIILPDGVVCEYPIERENGAIEYHKCVYTK